MLDPTQNIADWIPNPQSPLVHEFPRCRHDTRLFGTRGYGEVSYIARVTHDLIEDYQTLQTGVTNVIVNGISAGLFTNRLNMNAPNDQVYRKYQGLVFQSRYRITDHWSVNGQDTVQLQNFGNYEGEGANNTPGSTSRRSATIPEAFPTPRRTFPFGDLQSFERNRLRLWSIYNWQMGSRGALSTPSGLLHGSESRAYFHSLAAKNVPLTSTQVAILNAAGYPDQPGPQTVFFTGARGDQNFAGYGVFDMSINYDVPVFRTLKPWVKFDVYNLFNNEKLIAWSTTVSPNKASATDSLGLPTGYTPKRLDASAPGHRATQ